LLTESIEFTTCEGDYKRRSEGSCNCHTITRLILAAEKWTFNYCNHYHYYAVRRCV